MKIVLILLLMFFTYLLGRMHGGNSAYEDVTKIIEGMKSEVEKGKTLDEIINSLGKIISKN